MKNLFNYTHENHFAFGYKFNDHHYWMEPKASDVEGATFAVGYGRCQYEALNFKVECYRAAQLIHESTDLIANIMFSGGNESEIVVRSFHDQGIPFKVSILKFKHNLNIHDISFAVVFCEQRNIEYDIFELDIKDFWDDGIYEYAKRTQCPTPQLPSAMWLADQIDGLPVMGSGEPYIAKVVPDDYVPGESPYEPSEWQFQEKERIQAWYRHFLLQDRPAVPGFFQYTPELMYTFLNSPVVRELVNNERHGKLSSVSTKGETYRLWFSDMIPRPKFSGFEKVMDWEEIIRESLTEKYGQYDRVVSVEYHKFLDNLRYG
jgi:hypothetical protein